MTADEELIELVAMEIARRAPCAFESRDSEAYRRKDLRFDKDFSPNEQACFRVVASAAIKVVQTYAAKRETQDKRTLPMTNPLYFFTCPECEYDSEEAGRLSFSDSGACPLCAVDSGRDVEMRFRHATTEENIRMGLATVLAPVKTGKD